MEQSLPPPEKINLPLHAIQYSVKVYTTDGIEMPSKAVQKHLKTIALLSHCQPCVIKKFIQQADTHLINAICECSKNILRGNIKLSEEEYKRLKRYQSHLRQLSTRKTSLKKKKELIQKGGFLPALIAPLIGLLGSVISSVIARKAKK